MLGVWAEDAKGKGRVEGVATARIEADGNACGGQCEPSPQTEVGWCHGRNCSSWV
jgi:hypothetical protein